MIDARIRRRHSDLVPLPAAPWPAQIPQTNDPERRRFFAQLAMLMDDRRRRIGEHAAAISPPWAVAALGPVPDDPTARLAWQHKAAAIGAYRELSGHHNPDDPIGPDPATGSPDLRAAWHQAQVARAAIDVAEASRLVRELALRLGQAGPAIPLGPAQRRTASLRPPALEIPPSPWILERTADRGLEPEAAD